MRQEKLFKVYGNVKSSEWIIKQLKEVGMTYTEMAHRMGVHRSTLYRYKKGIHKSPKMTKKIQKLFDISFFGVAIFYDEGHGSPYLIGYVYLVVYNETDLYRLINFDKIESRTLVYSKFIKRFTSAMVVKHQEIALELIKKYLVPFRNLDRWLIEQIQLMRTQKTRDKTLDLLDIDYQEET